MDLRKSVINQSCPPPIIRGDRRSKRKKSTIDQIIILGTSFVRLYVQTNIYSSTWIETGSQHGRVQVTITTQSNPKSEFFVKNVELNRMVCELEKVLPKPRISKISGFHTTRNTRQSSDLSSQELFKSSQKGHSQHVTE